jgi:hypothetical protein
MHGCFHIPPKPSQSRTQSSAPSVAAPWPPVRPSSATAEWTSNRVVTAARLHNAQRDDTMTASTRVVRPSTSPTRGDRDGSIARRPAELVARSPALALQRRQGLEPRTHGYKSDTGHVTLCQLGLAPAVPARQPRVAVPARAAQCRPRPALPGTKRAPSAVDVLALPPRPAARRGVEPADSASDARGRRRDTGRE